MSVTDSDTHRAATTTASSEPPEGARDPQLARPRDGQSSTASAIPAPASGDAPWSDRAGKAIRGSASATLRHPRDWACWDLHPASPRAVARRAVQAKGWDSDTALVRWPVRIAWGLLITWALACCLAAVAPRNKICWFLAIVVLTARLVWGS